MPYTAPSTLVSGASRLETTASTRSQSCKPATVQNQALPKPAPGPGLTSSTSSYLHKHRRSPSISKTISSETSMQNGINGASTATREKDKLDGSTLPDQCRSSPTKLVVAEAKILSPPESSHTSSDDEINSNRGRHLVNLAELQDAIRTIEQHRTSSPERRQEMTKHPQITLDMSRVQPDLPDQQSNEQTMNSVRPPLSAGARKISHSRSNTASSALRDFQQSQLGSPSQSQSESDQEEFADDERRLKPAMIRKKSGELVRPALRPSYSKRRPSSMPGTPTFSKAVHFDPSLEHVRHFLQVDRPIAVSAGSSPMDTTLDEEGEFPFSAKSASISLPFEWEIRLTNFPPESTKRMTLPVKVERVYLSTDNKNLMGAIAVQNLSFHKLVVARFTLDYWKTTSEVVADYSTDVRRKYSNDGYDRFVFGIKLEDQAHLEDKTLFFCVRYNVNGQEYWDNNSSVNYQVDFSKKPVAQNGKNGARGNHARPLYASRSVSSSRPLSMPISSDDFATCFPPYEFPSLHQSTAQMIGDTPLQFRAPQAGRETISARSGHSADVFSQAFGSRYDFGVSLSAAINAGSSPSDRNRSWRESKPAPSKTMSFVPQLPVASSSGNAGHSQRGERQGSGPNTSGTSGVAKVVPQALTGEKPALQSSSYHDLLDKYCFVRARSARTTGE